ncbi:Uncharacterised protein [Mycobacteroides abscessus subsp. abscessus]|nr:Uncharacterised protein [Mycobacteroides abscessus subsp. abscessus]
MPTGVSGTASSTMITLGTMYPGSVSPTAAFSASGCTSQPGVATTYDTSAVAPAGVVAPIVSANSTSGRCSSAASISPSSMR